MKLGIVWGSKGNFECYVPLKDPTLSWPIKLLIRKHGKTCKHLLQHLIKKIKKGPRDDPLPTCAGKGIGMIYVSQVIF